MAQQILNISPLTPSNIERNRLARRRDVRALKLWLEGKTHEEIADLMGVRVTTIKQKMPRTLELLYFRVQDRSQLEAKPPRPHEVGGNAFWLEKLNQTEELLLELNPPK